jgi:hypothetical protein
VIVIDAHGHHNDHGQTPDGWSRARLGDWHWNFLLPMLDDADDAHHFRRCYSDDSVYRSDTAWIARMRGRRASIHHRDDGRGRTLVADNRPILLRSDGASLTRRKTKRDEKPTTPGADALDGRESYARVV